MQLLVIVFGSGHAAKRPINSLWSLPLAIMGACRPRTLTDLSDHLEAKNAQNFGRSSVIVPGTDHDGYRPG
jgi:hypothetical protein